ncbi:MAG: endolytic transglycosylase MltG [Pseudomonadota bacterium]
MRRLMGALVALVLVGCAAAAAAVWWWQQALPLRLKSGETVVDVVIPSGTAAQRVAQLLVEAGVDVPTWALYAAIRLTNQQTQLKAGTYEIAPGTTPEALLDKLVRGQQALRKITFIEGWTFAQMRKALEKAEHLKPSTQTFAPEQIMSELGRAGVHPEGRFFPDTYVYAKNSRDIEVLKMALQAMDQKLAQAWGLRGAGLPLKSADEALILASIIEKETGQEADRRLVSGVFINRMHKNMRLQTDPTVIYGMGAAFQGRLRRVDLDTDTPYNTYTRAGLPPTPIAMPGWASLKAAVQPAQTPALYFVARGDGSSQFSATLEEHNRAVRRYILNQ